MKIIQELMSNFHSHFVVPLNNRARIKSGNIDLYPVIRYCHDTPCTFPGAIWILVNIISPETIKVCIYVAVNIQ